MKTECANMIVRDKDQGEKRMRNLLKAAYKLKKIDTLHRKCHAHVNNSSYVKRFNFFFLFCYDFNSIRDCKFELFAYLIYSKKVGVSTKSVMLFVRGPN